MKVFEMYGKIIEIGEISKVGEYKKREIVIQVDSKADFSTNICLVAWKDKAEDLSQFNVGDNVTAEFRPKSIKSKKGTWFSNLNLVSMNETKSTEIIDGNSDDDDLPF